MKERLIYLDVLRVIATIMVVVLHVSAQNITNVDVSSYEWHVFNIFDSASRWTVPVFVMISGALFLEHEHTIKVMYRKYILRIITAFIFWSAIYAVVEMIRTQSSVKEAIWLFIMGPVHMWFLYMIIGIYSIVPFLRKIVKEKKLMQYFLALGLFFSFVMPQLIEILKIIFPFGKKVLDYVITNVDLHIVLGFAFYFVLGYYLNKREVCKKERIIIYIMGLCGLIVTIVMTLFLSKNAGETITVYYGNFKMNILAESIAVFVFAKYILNDNKNNIVKKLSKYSFGTYLVHMLIISLLNEMCGINTLSFEPICAVFVITVLVVVVSFVCSYILNNIPILKKHVV